MTPETRLVPATREPPDGDSQPARAKTPTSLDRAGLVVMTVARSEMSRLVRHPLVVLSLGLAAGLLWWGFRLDAPVLDRDSVRLVGYLLPVGAATMIAAHGMAARSRRGRVAELLETLPTAPARRILGEVLAVLGPVTLTTVFVGVGMVFLATGDPVGEWRWLELAGAPLMVLLAGALGVALAQWLPNQVTPYLTVVALAYLQAWTHPHTAWEIAEHVGALSPFQQMNLELPYAWQGRSAAAHVGWLVAVTVVLLAVAVVRWSRSRWVSATLVVGVGAAILSGTAAVAAVIDGPPSEVEAHLDAYGYSPGLATHPPSDDGVLTCHQRESYEVCAVNGYEGWIPRWEATFQRIVDVVPSDVERIRQWPRWFASAEDTTVVPTIAWGRGSSVASMEFELAIQVAVRAMTSTETYPARDDDWRTCSFAGEARAAIAIWLAAQGAPDVAEYLEQRVEQARRDVWFEVDEDGVEHSIDYPGDLWLGVEAYRTSLAVPDGDLALAMLDLPLDDVRRTVSEDLERWRDPEVTGDELAATLGLPAPEPITDVPSYVERCP